MTPVQYESPQVIAASYVLVVLSLLMVMHFGLLAGLLSACVGFLLTRWLTVHLGRIQRYLPVKAENVAATLVLLAPLVLLAIALSGSRSYIIGAPLQYRELLDFLARTVLELRENLPPEIASQLPDGADEIQRALASYLGAKAGALASAGRAWLGGLLYAYVGGIVGALAALGHGTRARGPLIRQLAVRVTRLGDAFRQIVAAQFWIAAFNTSLTAIFLLLVLPLWGMKLPYTAMLITLTFVGGLIPIVGNLICNSVITLVGLSVSPYAAAACLGFLILIHKAEYVINAKVVGQRTHIRVWELLAVLFVAEPSMAPRASLPRRCFTPMPRRNWMRLG